MAAHQAPPSLGFSRQDPRKPSYSASFSSDGAPPAPEHPEDPEDRRSPGAEGLCSRISTPEPSFPAAGTGWARGRSPPRSPEDRGRGAGGLPSARSHQPSGRPYLQVGRLLGGRRARVMGPRGSAVPGHRGGDARGGDGADPGPGQRTQPSGCWRPGLGALRTALRVTAAEPHGWRIGGGRGGSPALAPSRPAPGVMPEPGAGTRSRPGRGR